MILSGTRCVLSYVVLPAVAVGVGTTHAVGPAIGLAVGIAALVADVVGLRRFWSSASRWRWLATLVYTSVIILVAVLVANDLSALIA
jgi:hypothetical protein